MLQLLLQWPDNISCIELHAMLLDLRNTCLAIKVLSMHGNLYKHMYGWLRISLMPDPDGGGGGGAGGDPKIWVLTVPSVVAAIQHI